MPPSGPTKRSLNFVGCSFRKVSTKSRGQITGRCRSVFSSTRIHLRGGAPAGHPNALFRSRCACLLGVLFSLAILPSPPAPWILAPLAYSSAVGEEIFPVAQSRRNESVRGVSLGSASARLFSKRRFAPPFRGRGWQRDFLWQDALLNPSSAFGFTRVWLASSGDGLVIQYALADAAFATRHCSGIVLYVGSAFREASVTM